MIFNGFQKLTLLDFPGKTACTLFLAGCNFRCPFCHNASLVTHIENYESHTEDEILSFLKKRQGLLDGVCVTGGEPLLQKGLADFLVKVKDLGYKIKLDTNGSNPKALKELVEKGLVNYVAMDVKGSMKNYARCVGIEGFDTQDIEESIDYLLSNAVDYEFRTTVVAELHDIQDIVDLAARIKGAKRYFLQNFVDSGDLIGQNLSAVQGCVMAEMCKEASKFVESAKIRGI